MMRTAKILAAIAVLGLIAGPALATVRTYETTADQIVVSPSAPGGFTDFPAGSYEGPHSRTIIDDTGFFGDPLLVQGYAQSELRSSFDCTSTSGVVGCVVFVQSQTLATTAGAGNLPSTIVPGVSDLGGIIVTFPSAAITVQFPPNGPSLGQYCSASFDNNLNPNPSPSDIAAVAAYCNDWLGFVQDAWSENVGVLIPTSPASAGQVHFSADFSNFETPEDRRYFSHVAAPDLIYGLVTKGYGVAPQPLPVPLAPMAALALGGSLAYMGVNALRRK